MSPPQIFGSSNDHVIDVQNSVMCGDVTIGVFAERAERAVSYLAPIGLVPGVSSLICWLS
jgi:hypothetical protein